MLLSQPPARIATDQSKYRYSQVRFEANHEGVPHVLVND